MQSPLYFLSAKNIAGESVRMDTFCGSVLLIVNVASRCVFTSQYKQLQELYSKYRNQGFTILGFPCNQFGDQEPGSETEIQSFCSLTYDVTFPMFSKIEVNGASGDPIFVYLKKQAKGFLGSEAIKWNFTKFLVGRDGQVLGRYAPTKNPKSLSKSIEKAIMSL